MYKFLIKNYVKNKLSKEDIKNFALNEGISLFDNEVEVFYSLIKEHCDDLLNNNLSCFSYLKDNVRTFIYDKAINLFEEYKKRYF